MGVGWCTQVGTLKFAVGGFSVARGHGKSQGRGREFSGSVKGKRSEGEARARGDGSAQVDKT